MKTPNLKDLIEIWNPVFLENEKEKLEKTIEQKGLCLFIEFENEVYGTTEEGRLIFAKLKDKEESQNWKKESTFTATNLKTLKDRVFGIKNIQDIKVIDLKQAIKKVIN
jgi:hypothetical protein